ncbi:sugar phosphate isomerase/epimerase family protein [Nakamurella aerolata]|uniref:TIM barrel protein n=1 Tax=Nakamurella aerolata TaxID=1656892 RepID=A0A849ABK9_9ACTN|nr:sugar phosphate isomerase/epimerase family protein [Nakamurella aerolata]NNG36976.1 TIM barrel protein [Nakamurella aerolata]
MSNNKIGVHALVWVGGWSEDEARTAISSTKKAGYDVIELALMQPEKEPVDAMSFTADLLSEYGITPTMSMGLSDDTDVSSDDADIVAAGRRRLEAAVNVARDIGCQYLGGVIFSKLGRYTQPVTERGYSHSVETMAWLADKAAESGITLGMEFCNRYETNVINTTEQTLRFIEAIGRDNVVAHLDTYHMNIEERSFTDAVKAAADAGKLGYVHVGESHRGQLGTGSIPWDEFFTALRDVGYDGTITFESFSSEVVNPQLSSALSIWRNLWTDSMDLATGARAFIRDKYGA